MAQITTGIRRLLQGRDSEKMLKSLKIIKKLNNRRETGLLGTLGRREIGTK